MIVGNARMTLCLEKTARFLAETLNCCGRSEPVEEVAQDLYHRMSDASAQNHPGAKTRSSRICGLRTSRQFVTTHGSEAAMHKIGQAQMGVSGRLVAASTTKNAVSFA